MGHRIDYYDDPDVLRARATGGQLTTSSESTEVRWITRSELADLQLDRSMRHRIAHYLKGPATPHIG
jgi:hypothetical protein